MAIDSARYTDKSHPIHLHVAFTRNEEIKISSHYTGVNYFGFKERYDQIRDGRVALAYLDGSGALDGPRTAINSRIFSSVPTIRSSLAAGVPGGWLAC
jgi:hypothetical protein